MGTPVDMGGDDLYVNAIYVNNSGPGQLAATGFPAFQKVVATAVNFNATADTPVAMSIPAGVKNYIVNSIRIVNANHTLITATVGVFGAPTGGVPTIAADQAITVTNNAPNTLNNTQLLTLSPGPTIAFNLPTLYVRVGTPEGVAATADVVITIQILN